MADEHTELTLSVLSQAHVYKLPPRPSSGGWRCQDWPKTNHIFTARVRIVACGAKCTIRLEDPTNGTLFAMCPLDNEKPQLSVEPVADSSRYFVIRVDDGSGRHAFLGMGFLERDHAFEFNVTLQDHVKRLKYEREAEEAAAAPALPAQDFSLKGTISIGIPGGGGGSQRARPPAAASDAVSLTALAPPPPANSSGGRRPVASGASAAAGESPAASPDPFGASPFGSDPFGGDAFAPAAPAGGAALGGDPAVAAPEGNWVAFG
ncbi:hypothetical protein AB1Y20_006299 [Prymnesium parvum]|uniref:NECAP PHear domain-containing protein n=1 Tax=Prymnesium parvum TaxID=97485 RepID=A0AB34J2C0_PRYPA